MRRLRSPGRAAALPGLGLALVLLAASCTDFFNGLLDNPAPTGVRAGDGKEANGIPVDWNAPGLSSEKWQGYTVDHYVVSWSGPSSGWASVEGTSYTIHLVDGDRAKSFSVTVESFIRSPGGSTESGGWSSDEGFAIYAPDLAWPDRGGSEVVAGAEGWYTTMLQQGFDYRVTFAAGHTGSVEYFDFETLSPSREAQGPVSGTLWTCDARGKGGKFYLHVVPDLPGTGFTNSYGF